MQTVVETQAYIAKTSRLLSEDERADIITHIANNPEAGVLIRGSGGVRKQRHARAGMGKSSGVRVIYFFYNDDLPIFLLTVFAKNERTNLRQAEINQLATVCKQIRNTYGIKQ